jgi:hypothetical protein
MSRPCDPTSRFGTPVPIPGLETVKIGYPGPHLSADELTIYFHGAPSGLFRARRSALTEAFSAPEPLTALSSSSGDYDPSITSDGLTLWFASTRVMNEAEHLFVATRPSILAEFGAPGLATRVNATDTQQADFEPFPTADGSELWFVSTRTGSAGGRDLWRAVRSGDAFATPMNVLELNSSTDELSPTLSVDRRTIYFSSTRAAPGTKGGVDVWTSHRETVTDAFPAPTLVNELNTAGSDYATWLSADNCRLYGTSTSSKGTFPYVAVRQP